MADTAGYTVPPPSYNAAQPKPSYGAARASTDAEAGLLDDGDEGEWKIETTVAQSSAEVRHAFVRKVYSLLFAQLLATAAVGAVMRTDGARAWVLANTWSMWLALIGSFGSLFACYGFRYKHPAGLLSLGSFTAFEAFAVGAAVSFYDQQIVLQALLITCFVVVGLTIFTFQSKFDFSSLGPWLTIPLLCLVGTGLIGIFVPFSKTVDMVYAGCGVLVFSLYLIYDTHMILNRLSPDDVIMAVLSLYLDILNLFLMILRLLNNAENR